MKRKIKKCFKKHWKGISAVLIVAGVFTLYLILNGLAEEIRGYKGIGGEIFIFFIPFAIVYGRDLIHEAIDLFK